MSSSRPRNSQERGPSSSRHSWNASDTPATISTTRIESALKNASKKNTEYEHKMKDLEARLTEGLSNFRAIDDQLQEVFTGLQRDAKRAERAVNYQVPQIRNELDDSMDALTELSETLPTIQSQVLDIRMVYDSGRDKAQALVSDLTWLNTEFYERWRTIIFTSGSPVSWRWKVYMRSVFVVSFVICSWLFWIAITGAYRAHRHRLVWGEKLMS
ncbi:hypothetical protein B0H34DRAFT_703583 [Crassisporium funariophilum]|nr:hypothetical protein B0H34DRAFT_703583 [Crassisporium funariophilum]